LISVDRFEGAHIGNVLGISPETLHLGKTPPFPKRGVDLEGGLREADSPQRSSAMDFESSGKELIF